MTDYNIDTKIKGGRVIGLVNEEVFKGKPKETPSEAKEEKPVTRKKKTTK